MARLKPDFEEVIPLKMIPLSLKLNPKVLDNMEAVRAIIKQNRNTYINLAIDAFNHYHRYKMIKKRMNQDAYGNNIKQFEIWTVEWRNNPNDVKREFPSASIIENNRFVFNIKGNSYRLIVKINYGYQIIWIRFIGTHKQYDKIDASNI